MSRVEQVLNATSTTARLDRVWNLGYDAAKDRQVYDNPYASSTREAASFEQGYLAGRFARGMEKTSH